MTTRAFLVLLIWALLGGPGLAAGTDLYDETVVPVVALQFSQSD